MALELIDKQDGFELVRDKIAAILTLEVANQRALAVADGKDPDDYSIRIYSERANPWEQWLNYDDETDVTPICNVWLDSSDFAKSTGNTVSRQRSASVYNIDVYAFGATVGSLNSQIPGDQQASFNLHRGIKIVRNILMAADYIYLGLRGTVTHRWINTVTVFQPEFDGRSMQNIMAGRIAFNVEFNEFSPQVEAETLEYLSVIAYDKNDGRLLIQTDFDYTTI